MNQPASASISVVSFLNKRLLEYTNYTTGRADTQPLRRTATTNNIVSIGIRNNIELLTDTLIFLELVADVSLLVSGE